MSGKAIRAATKVWLEALKNAALKPKGKVVLSMAQGDTALISYALGYEIDRVFGEDVFDEIVLVQINGGK